MLPILWASDWTTIYSYPLLMGLAWGLAYRYCLSTIETNSLSEKGFKGLFFGVFVSSWVGAKVFYIYFSYSGEFTELAMEPYFWTGGGFVFLGGVLCATIYILIYSYLLKKYPFHSFYHFLPGVCFAHAIGRLGCFLAGCCYGIVCELPWRVHLHGEFRHPVQLYEAVAVLLLGMYLQKNKNRLQQDTIFTYFYSYGFLRFGLEFFRGDTIRGTSYLGLSSSQVFSLFFIFLCAIIQIRKKNQAVSSSSS